MTSVNPHVIEEWYNSEYLFAYGNSTHHDKENRMKIFKHHKSMICTLLFVFLAGIAFAQDPTVIVENAYQDILGRKADKAGMREFRSKIIDQGWTEKNVRNALRQSPEFNQSSADAIVKRAYEDILGREPDRNGKELYRKNITEHNWTEKQVRDNLRLSQEYKNKHN
jgi:hypothetical protein